MVMIIEISYELMIYT